MSTQTINNRLQSLDIFRGLTVALMIVVNNGVGHEQYSTLTHSKWNGLTLCDLVFPFFLFMVGVSAYLALRRCNFTPSKEVVISILKRSAIFFAIGVAIHAWEMMVYGHWDFLPTLRVWGVMQRIALCYCFISLLLLYVTPKALMSIAAGLLVIYTGILVFGNGYAQDESNILSVVDRFLFTKDHLYMKSPVDPEGLVGTISSFAHVCIGAYIGYSICHKIELKERMKRVASIGTIILVLGLIASIWLPLNKRVWSSSYVLVTCGIATLVLILLTYIADHHDKWKWFDLFRRAGRHTFFIYVVSEMLAPVIGLFEINEGVYAALCKVFSPEFSSFLYSAILSFLLLCYGYVPQRKKKQ